VCHDLYLMIMYNNDLSINDNVQDRIIKKQNDLKTTTIKILRGPTESYGNGKYYYLWVHNQCVRHTPSRGSRACPHRKILKNEYRIRRLNLKAILANNFMLLCIL